MSTAPLPVRSASQSPATDALRMLRYDLLEAKPIEREPFEYFLIPHFIHTEHLEAIGRDFPDIKAGGSFPLASLTFGPAFQQLTDELVGDRLREALAKKFEMDLAGRPTTLTVRGCTRLKDGQIHTDGASKLITVLLYLNRGWQGTGGRLRLLRSKTNMDDVIAEVPPTEGSLVAFRCRPNAWHGHHQYEGPRRTLQLNYVTNNLVSHWTTFRHGVSAILKSVRG